MALWLTKRSNLYRLNSVNSASSTSIVIMIVLLCQLSLVIALVPLPKLLFRSSLHHAITHYILRMLPLLLLPPQLPLPNLTIHDYHLPNLFVCLIVEVWLINYLYFSHLCIPLILLGSSMLSNVFCEFIFDCNLTQHVTQPTHKKGNTVDLVLTSPSVNIEQLSVNSQLLSDFSDHFIISFDVSYSSPSTNISKSLYVFDFSKANFTDICSFLLDFDFSVCFQSHDIEFIWSNIKSVIFVAISLFVPRIKSKWINELKWFNSEIRHHHNCLRTMKRKYKIHPTPNRKLQIEQSETSLMSRTAQAKAHYETNLILSSLSIPTIPQLSIATSMLSLIKMPFHLLLPSGIDVLSQTITEHAYSMSSSILSFQAAHSDFLH